MYKVNIAKMVGARLESKQFHFRGSRPSREPQIINPGYSNRADRLANMVAGQGNWLKKQFRTMTTKVAHPRFSSFLADAAPELNSF
jgi:hypothetical protein